MQHNYSVCNLSKNTIWKQITTDEVQHALCHHLYAIYQRTQSESKSQLQELQLHSIHSVCNLSKNTIWKQITTPEVGGCHSNLCMQSIKEHNLKANHNKFRFLLWISYLYAIYQRTQSESKSQHLMEKSLTTPICMQSIKEHNLKANHNALASCLALSSLYAIYQRTQSESKSQHCWDT